MKNIFYCVTKTSFSLAILLMLLTSCSSSDQSNNENQPISNTTNIIGEQNFRDKINDIKSVNTENMLLNVSDEVAYKSLLSEVDKLSRKEWSEEVYINLKASIELFVNQHSYKTEDIPHQNSSIQEIIDGEYVVLNGGDKVVGVDIQIGEYSFVPLNGRIRVTFYKNNRRPGAVGSDSFEFSTNFNPSKNYLLPGANSSDTSNLPRYDNVLLKTEGDILNISQGVPDSRLELIPRVHKIEINTLSITLKNLYDNSLHHEEKIISKKLLGPGEESSNSYIYSSTVCKLNEQEV